MVGIHNNSATQKTPPFYPSMLTYSSSFSAKELLSSCYLVTYRLSCQSRHAVCQLMAPSTLHNAFETIHVPTISISLNCQAGFCQVRVQTDELPSTSFRILDKLVLSTYSGKRWITLNIIKSYKSHQNILRLIISYLMCMWGCLSLLQDNRCLCFDLPRETHGFAFYFRVLRHMGS